MGALANVLFFSEDNLKNNILLWIAAIVITLASAYYQRTTGPTYPIDGNVNIDGKDVSYILHRSHGGESDYIISINIKDAALTGKVIWKRYKTKDEWTEIAMSSDGSKLSASLPNQPPAGKLIYKVILNQNGKEFPINENKPVVIRFKGDVPATILIPHIFFIFFAMLLSTRTGFEALRKEPKLKNYSWWTFAFLIIGGLIFGPLTQLYAFGALWTGFPFGYDLTDNKTLIAFIGWLIAMVAIYKFNKPKMWVIAASVITLIIFLIPHSLLGSELDYEKLDKQKLETQIEIGAQ